MKGTKPTKAEQAFWHDLAGLGCCACRKDGRVNPWVSIHHIDGRTKPDAHMLVLALCAEHHQHNDMDPLGRIGVHPYKARFEQQYGSQMDLLAESKHLLGAGE
jgi:hypothetical protein